MIVSITPSDRAGKRLKATYKDGDKTKTIHFGSKGATTYIDGASETTRANYLKRHLANATEKRLIENNIISPALLSARLLWGDSRSLDANLRKLNRDL